MLAGTSPDTVRARVRGEGGSYLIEVIVSALILVIVALGVLKSLDRGTALGAEQKVQAVAGNVAHAELEQIRALPVTEVSNLRRVSTKDVGGVTYTATTRADWVNDASGDSGCTTAGSKADYMKLSTTVTWPQMGTRKPVTIESLRTPGVRAFDSDQGSLAVRVTRADGVGLSGLQLNLTGGATLSDATSDKGCVLWGYLDSGSVYTLGFSLAGHVLENGSQVASLPVAVVGGQTSNVAVQYDLGGRIQTTFKTKRPATVRLIPTSPQAVHVRSSGGGGVSVAYTATGDQATSGLLFPFTSSGYTIHPDSCAAAEVPVPPPLTTPRSPAAPLAVSATVKPGETTTSANVRVPALNMTITSSGVAVSGAQIRVTSPCGTVYRRTTDAAGLIDDPGFPYATSVDICVSDGTRKLQTTRDNTNFNGTQLDLTIAATDPAGTCT